MFVTLTMIRVPRIVLNFLARKYPNKPGIQKLEFVFRKISFFSYLPVALIF